MTGKILVGNAVRIDKHNGERVKKLISLKSGKKREALGVFVVEGRRAIETFITAGWSPLEILLSDFVVDDSSKGFLEFLKILADRNISPTLVADLVMSKISNQTTNSGYFSVFKRPCNSLLGDFALEKTGLLMFEVGDPGNMGSLIRTAVALDVGCVIIGGCDPWGPKVVQSSAGNLALAKIIKVGWEEFLLHKGDEISLSALVSSDGLFPKTESLRNSILVVGNEAHGLPSCVLDRCDRKITLPMSGVVDSLNVAIAGSIALYFAYALDGEIG